MMGTVYLVGSGPGDPDLLTLRAARLLRETEVVLYDRLVDQSILDMIPASAKKMYVGRAVGDDTTHQNQTNQTMLSCARTYSHVVRLKGGDPIIFGRGGEEAEFLRSQSIPYEIVPGITSGIGSATYSGIPLTHREHSSSVAFVTGHEYPEKTVPAVDWKKLAGAVDTIVIMMGLTRMRIIAEDLMQGGMSPDTPVAIIYRGTTKQQRTMYGTLSTISNMAESMRPPVNIIIGKVVDMHKRISWR